MMGKVSAFFSGGDADTNFGVREEGHQLASADIPVDGPLEGTKLDRSAKRISLDRIIAKEQVRKEFDEAELKELAHSLDTLGQQQPILVYWSEADSKYVIIAGERRFRAAKLAEIDELSCKIHPHEPEEAELVELQFVENAVRTDLNPIEEALSYHQLQTLKSMSTTQLAERIGKNQSTISRSLRLLKLPENIQQHIAKGELPVSVAREIGKLKKEDEQQAMAERYLAGELTTAKAQEATTKKAGGAKRASTKQSKKWSRGTISISAGYPRGVTQAELADALVEIAEGLRADKRGKRAA